MNSTKVYRGIAVAAVFSFLIPPMLLVTILAFCTVFSEGISKMFEYPANWLLIGPFAFSVITCFWAPSHDRAKVAITVTNLLILTCCIVLGLAILLGFTSGPKT